MLLLSLLMLLLAAADGNEVDGHDVMVTMTAIAATAVIMTALAV